MNRLLLFFIFSFISFQAHALSPIYLDIHGSVGKGVAEVEQEAVSPDIIQYGAGTTIGLNYFLFFVGASFDYYLLEQMSEVKTPYGNRKGVRTNLFSPTIGISLPKLTLKFDYQLKGDYELSKKTASNQILKYESPSGYRIYFGYGFGFMPFGSELGFFYENIEYEKEITETTEVELTNKLVVNQVGLMFNLSF